MVCHFRAGGNPVFRYTRVAEHGFGFVRFAVVFYCWIPACAGMTRWLFFYFCCAGYSNSQYPVGVFVFFG